MDLEKMNLNTPVWKPVPNHSTQNTETSSQDQAEALPTFQETWYLDLNHPNENRALSLKFGILITANGFRRIAEVSAIYFNKSSNQDPVKLAFKQRHEIGSFFFSEEEGIRIGECELSKDRTVGKIYSKGHSISWDLKLAPRPLSANFKDSHYDLVPSSLRKTGLIKNSVITTHTDLTFTGTCEIDGQILQWDRSPGMQGHQNGPKNGHSWTWGHCNSFTEEHGIPATLIFEGLSVRARWLGWIPSPKITSLYFRYRGKSYFLNSIKDFFKLRSWNTRNEWNFRADQDDLSFRGALKAQHKDFAGVTLEDTNGSLIYCSKTKVAELIIHVYRHGKLEATFTSNGGAAFEIASRDKNPYIPQIL